MINLMVSFIYLFITERLIKEKCIPVCDSKDCVFQGRQINKIFFAFNMSINSLSIGGVGAPWYDFFYIWEKKKAIDYNNKDNCSDVFGVYLGNLFSRNIC